MMNPNFHRWVAPFIAVAIFSNVRAGVHFGNGIKIGELDASSAIVWMRLTDAPERRADGTPFKDNDNKVPDGLRLSDMKDSLTGVPGSVRLRYKARWFMRRFSHADRGLP